VDAGLVNQAADDVDGGVQFCGELGQAGVLPAARHQVAVQVGEPGARSARSPTHTGRHAPISAAVIADAVGRGDRAHGQDAGRPHSEGRLGSELAAQNPSPSFWFAQASAVRCEWPPRGAGGGHSRCALERLTASAQGREAKRAGNQTTACALRGKLCRPTSGRALTEASRPGAVRPAGCGWKCPAWRRCGPGGCRLCGLTGPAGWRSHGWRFGRRPAWLPPAPGW
jgi:hypothetical protein